MQFRDFDVSAFLRDHWQKQPLLIRNPWDAWRNPLDPDALAGLSCEAEVESRLILRKRARWKLEQGPFAAKRFARLGKWPWTLLVQAVDQHVPEVAALLAPFRFIPNWRIDDVMVSYAVDGGGAGAHFDRYDVFLIQGLGRRRWRIGEVCDASTPLLPHEDLRLLADFEPVAEWELEPGDMLYLPPGVAHEGVALGDDCMTYSIGFRAPSRAELIAHYCDDLLARLGEDDRYGDPDLAVQDNPGEIGPAALDRLHAMVRETLDDRAAFARWFARYASTPKYGEAEEMGETPCGEIPAQGVLLRNPASRFAFIRQAGEALLLFVDGQCHACAGEAAAFAEQLCAQDRIALGPEPAATDAVKALLAALIAQGSVAFEEED